MIKLTRLDGEAFVLNADLIRYVERRPDTFVTLTSGERIVVAETMDDVIEKAVHYQQRKHYFPLAAGGSIDPGHQETSSTGRNLSSHDVAVPTSDTETAAKDPNKLQQIDTNRAGDASPSETL